MWFSLPIMQMIPIVVHVGIFLDSILQQMLVWINVVVHFFLSISFSAPHNAMKYIFIYRKQILVAGIQIFTKYEDQITVPAPVKIAIE